MGNATVGMSDEEIHKISIKTIRFHSDPFYNACRAYGRLIDSGVNGKIAVRCHGHLDIPAAREKELAQRFDVYEWGRPTDDPGSKTIPLRARICSKCAN